MHPPFLCEYSLRMGNVIRLNKHRKAKARANKEAQATENRIKFGRTKAEKQRDALEQKRIETVDAHKRETPLDKGHEE